VLAAAAADVDRVAGDVARREREGGACRVRGLGQRADEADRPVVDDDDVVELAGVETGHLAAALRRLVDDRVTGQEVVRSAERDRLAVLVDAALLEDRAERQVVGTSATGRCWSRR
jgi:hypothetical protein